MVYEQKKEEWKNQACPYIFVLREGPSHQNNLLDYSLCMMQIRSDGYHLPSAKMIISPRNKYDSRLGSPAAEAKN
ncbi:MAG: hypothetical protein ACXWM7_03155 [Parachlamydiaceae bacterium]